MGSKNRIAKDIVPIIQKCIDDNNITEYYEPFCGGCNIIDKIKCKSKYASDTNKYLMLMLAHFFSGENWNELPNAISREHYSEVRECYNTNSNKFPDWYIGAIGFLASYNGRFFDGGYAGVVHTKADTIRDYYSEAKRNFQNQMDAFIDKNNTNFSYHDYQGLTKYKNINNSMIYCDIPYQGVKQYNTSKNFDYERFWDWVRKCSIDSYVLISELNAPDDFKCVWEQEVTRTVDNAKRVSSTEKLFTYIGGLYDNYIKNTSPQMA